MSSTQTAQVDQYVPESVSGPVAGGLVGTVLALLQLFVIPVTGSLGYVLYLLVWPVVAAAIGTAVDRGRGRESPLSGLLSGVNGALVVTLVVILTGLVGLWTGTIHSLFGVPLSGVVFSTFLETTIAWAVFGYATGYVLRQYGRSA